MKRDAGRHGFQPFGDQPRVDPDTGSVSIVADDFDAPNGLAFTPDETRLYITDTKATPRHLRMFSVKDDNSLAGGDVVATTERGGFDGFRFDEAGRIWMSAGDGVHCIDTQDHAVIGKVLVPELVANFSSSMPRRCRALR